ncbi:Gfo/Idh/MocA family oxidoreductase, partial [bacterium]
PELMAFRIGVAGTGVVAGYGHLPAIAENPDLELAIVYDPVVTSAERAGTRYGCPWTTDAERFYAHDFDAVTVASPLPTHREHVLRALESGRDVLCEKPLAVDDDEAAEMQSVAERTGRLLAVGFVYRGSDVTRTLKGWIDAGEIGELRLLRMSYLWNLHGRYAPDSAGEWQETPMWRGRMEEGGPMIDCGVHFIDLARLFTGSEIVEVQGAGAWVADYEAPDWTLGTLTHANGAVTMVEVGFTYGHTAKVPRALFTYDLVGTGGTARYDRELSRLELRNGEGLIEAHGGWEKDFVGMYGAWARALSTRDLGPLAGAEEARIASRCAIDLTRRAMNTKLFRRVVRP